MLMVQEKFGPCTAILQQAPWNELILLLSRCRAVSFSRSVCLSQSHTLSLATHCHAGDIEKLEGQNESSKTLTLEKVILLDTGQL